MTDEPKTSVGEPTWIRWIPHPAWGLPCLLLVAAALVLLSAYDPPSAMVTSLLALPIPFLAMRWGRLPSCIAIASIFLIALVVAPHAHGVAPFGERIAIQIVVVALVWEVVHAAANSQAAAAAEAAASGARHRLIVETLNELPRGFDPASRRSTGVGPPAERRLGHLPPEWLRAGFWSERLHRENRERVVSPCAAAAERGRDHEFEHRMAGADGHVGGIHDVVTIAAQGVHGPRACAVMGDRAPGSGTRIRHALPLDTSGRASIEVPGLASRASSSGGSGTVLVVDDEPAIRSAARRALERHGYVVHEAGDGLEALAALQGGHAVDAMVLDLTMPRLSGVETLRRVRGDRPSLPVVLVSGYAQGHHVDLDASGPVRFLRKPYRASELAAEVGALLGSEASPTKPWSHP